MAKLSASLSNFSSRVEIALLYSFVAVALVLGSLKFRMACERPGPKAKASGAGVTGMASGGGRGADSPRGAVAAAGSTGGAVAATG